MTRRMIIHLMVFLLIGAIVNVAVAVGWTLYADHEVAKFRKVRRGVSAYEFSGEDDHIIPYKDWVVSLTLPRGGMCASSTWRDADTTARTVWWRVESPAEPLVPSWASFIIPPQRPDTSGMEHVRIVEAWGWPVLTMCTKWSAESIQRPCPCCGRIHHARGVASGIPLPPIQRWVFSGVQPIWPGFAINTNFYAAILWLIFAATGFLRRRIRYEEGRCTRCGYDLRGHVADGVGLIHCPECGTVGSGRARYLTRTRELFSRD